MSILQLCERIQDTWVSRTISESTWGYPIIGALHVLAIVLFGVAILIPRLRALDIRWLRRLGLLVIVTTGALAFASGAARYYGSTSFRIKLILLALLALNAIVSRRHHRKLNSAIALVLWAAVIFASRGIAFF